jgi:hypothetical protein
MKIKVNMTRGLLESITKEVISEARVKASIRKKADHKKADHKKADHKKELKEIEMINETPIMDFINAVKDLDPAALTALGISSLPIGAAIKVIKDYMSDPRKAMEKLQDMGDTVSKNR